LKAAAAHRADLTPQSGVADKNNNGADFLHAVLL